MASQQAAVHFLSLAGILLLSALPSSSWACPARCSCAASLDLTQCSNLTSVPQDVPLSTTTLYVTHSALPVLPEGALSRYERLRLLTIQHCRLALIGHNAFSGLVRLTSLDLRWNRLERLRSYVFSGLPALTKLQLHYNHIHTIHDFAFHGLTLSQLGLDGNTELRTVSRRTFHGCGVEEMTVDGARLHDLGALSALRSSLRLLWLTNNTVPLTLPPHVLDGFTFSELRLSNNGLRSVDFLAGVTVRHLLSLSANPSVGRVALSQYSGLRQLETLELERTGFSEVRAEDFSALTHLRKLNLQHNGITSLPEALQPTLSNLVWLGLDGNPLHCNCELIWFKKWLSAERPTKRVECTTPRPALITDLSDAYMSCSAPTILPGLHTAWNVSAGSSLVLTCIGEGDPAPSVEWTAPNNATVRVEAPSNRSETQNQAVYHIEAAAARHQGLYTCTARSLVGRAARDVHVYVNDVIGYTLVEVADHEGPQATTSRAPGLSSVLVILFVVLHAACT